MQTSVYSDVGRIGLEHNGDKDLDRVKQERNPFTEIQEPTRIAHAVVPPPATPDPPSLMPPPPPPPRPDVMRGSSGLPLAFVNQTMPTRRETTPARIQRENVIFTNNWNATIPNATEHNDAVTRNFRGLEGVSRLYEFFEHVEEGKYEVLGARDFAYRDNTLESEIWLVDKTQIIAETGEYDADRAYVVMHVHTAEP